MLGRIAISIFILLFCLPNKIQAQYLPDPNYISFNTVDGLSNSIVYTIAQDAEGYMWFGTEDGLNRFDGHKFTVYKYSPSDENSLSGNKVNQIYLSPSNQLWIATANGLSKYNRDTNNFTNYRVSEGLSNNGIQTIFQIENKLWVGTDKGLSIIDLISNQISIIPISQDGSGTSHKWIRSITHKGNFVWVGTWGGGLNRYDLANQKFDYFFHDPKNNNSVSGNTIHSTYIDKQGELWVGTIKAGLNQYLPDCQCFNRIPPFKNYSDTTISGFAEFNDDLLVSSNIGLASLNHGSNKVTNYSLLKAHELGNLTRDIRSIYVSDDDTIWLGSFQLGVLAIPKNGFGFQSYSYSNTSANALMSDDINSLYIENDYLWTGSVGGLFRYPISEQGALGKAEKILDTFTLKIESVKDGTYWLATNDGLYHIDNTFSVISHHDHTKLIEDITGEGAVLDVIKTKNDELFAANWRGGLTKLIDEKKSHFEQVGLNGSNRAKQANNQIYVLEEGKNNTIWIGTRDGVNRYDISTDTLYHYSLQLEENQPKVTVYYVYIHQNQIYLGTSFGLYIYNEKNDKFNHISLNLKSNYIQAIAAESINELWLSTFNGLYKWHIKTNQLQSYFYEDGLQNSEFNTKGVAKDKHGNIYFSGIDGVTKIQPPQLNNIGKLGTLKWQNISADNNQLTIEENGAAIKLSYFVDDYFLPKTHQYRYKLNDGQWLNNRSNTEITLNSLNAGDYQVELQYKRDGFDWQSAESTYQITVLPPWYKTKVAIACYILLLIGFSYLLYSIRLRSVRSQNQLLEQKVFEQTSEISLMLTQKEQLFANISHELRTPITLINAPIEQLANDSSLTKQQTKLITLAKNNGQRLFSLVERILDLSKAKQKASKLTQINIDDLLIKYIIAFEPLMVQKNIKFEHSLASKAIITVDKEDIASVIENLLSNALKYTKDGGWVKLSSTIKNNEYSLTVSNQHLGLTDEQTSKIFNRFERLGQSDSEKGFGLGLSLVKEICNRYEWQIECKSNINDIAFNLTISEYSIEQVKSTPAQRQLIELGIKKNSKTSKLQHSVLVVEDNDELRNFIVELISNDYAVLTASNGKEALNIAIDKIPDLIISDVMMPEMDGFSLVKALSEHDNTCHIPTILLTAKADEQSKLEGLELGAIDYITKPFEARQLTLKVKNNLERIQKRLLTQVTNEEPEKNVISERDQKFIERLNKTVELNYQDNQFNVEKLVANAAMSERQLQRKLKALFNQTPAEYIRNYRLLKAKELLLKGKSISLTSDLVGFNSPSYFSRSFKTAFNQSPKEFITQHTK